MRLRELNLIRYGRFTNETLDFGEGHGETDVTIVYGENEAGKSTAFSAWLDLLFGLPLQHSYDFVHARKDLLIGATIITPDGPLALQRTGQRTGSLTDGQGRTIDERRLNLWLHGLDRDGYRTRFSLDDEVLRRGGEEIAAAKGDLGQLLHAGSSGLSGIAEVLKRAEQEVEQFHKPRGRTTTLAEARNRLKEVDGEIADAQLDPRRFDDLRRALQTAEAGYGHALAARDDAMRAVILREAADRRRTLAARMTELQQRLKTYPEGTDLPEDALARVSVAVDAIARAKEAQAEERATIQSADDRLAAFTPDPEGERIGAMLADLEAAEFDDGQPLVARASSADADIGQRTKDLEAAQARSADAAVALAGEDADPAALVLPPDVVTSLREAAHHVLATARSSVDAQDRLAEAQAELGEPETMPDGANALFDALKAYDACAEDPEDLAQHAEAYATEARRLTVGLGAHWRPLAEAGLPSQPEIRAAARRLDAADAALSQAADRAQEARKDVARKADERAAEVWTADIVTEDEIFQSRHARDGLWSEHRDKLDVESADAFEAAMRLDDKLRAQHGRSVEGRSRLARLDADISRSRADLDRREAEVLDAKRDREAPLLAMQALARRLGLGSEIDGASLADRRDVLHQALSAELDAERAAASAQSALETQIAARSRVIVAYEATAGKLPQTEDAILAARRHVDDLERKRTRISSRQEATRLVGKLQSEVETRRNAHAKAEMALAQSIQGLWCEGASAADMLRFADGLTSLNQRQTEAQTLERRVALLDAAVAAFRRRAEPLCAALDLTTDASVTGILRAARDRAQSAATTAQNIEQAEKARAEAEDAITKQERVIQTAKGDIARLFRSQYLAPGDDPVSAIKSLLQRDRLRAEIEDLRSNRCAAGAGFDQDLLADEEANVDPIRTESLRQALETAEADRDAMIDRRAMARTALDTALNKAGGSDHAQTRAALLQRLSEDARRAVLTRIGLMAASGALRQLREDRRGPMLDATERAFSDMTKGDWQRLEAQPTGAGERLVGIRKGAAVSADAMSTGTRGQLYLALRVAGHADFVERYGPLPFVTDDILETFDDERASAALRLTGEMGRAGQAIMFTHHRHLVDMARRAIPGVHVLELR